MPIFDLYTVAGRVACRTLLLAVIAVVAGAGLVVAPASAGATTRASGNRWHPARLAPAGADQVIVVSSRHRADTRATLRRWNRTANGWRREGRSVRAWIGRSGFVRARSRVQNTGTTPAGVFDLTRAFGARPAPRVRLPYFVVDGDDYWPGDPRDPGTYNVIQRSRPPGARWRTSPRWTERLAAFGRAYEYTVVIDFNMPRGVRRVAGERRAAIPADTSRGGAIFLHVSSRRPTAGCVAISRHQMRRTLRWLAPDRNPVIVTGWRASLRHRARSGR